jgi:hypothetical protein
MDIQKEAHATHTNVWQFEDRTGDHLIQLGTYLTCTCHKDLKCEHFKKVLRIVWDLNDAELIPITTHQLIYPKLMRPIRCPICLEASPWLQRGQDFTLCRFYLHVGHKACLAGCRMCPSCRKKNCCLDGLMPDFVSYLFFWYNFFLAKKFRYEHSCDK